MPGKDSRLLWAGMTHIAPIIEDTAWDRGLPLRPLRRAGVGKGVLIEVSRRRSACGEAVARADSSRGRAMSGESIFAVVAMGELLSARGVSVAFRGLE